ncbi:MAG: hypothetical protein HeimC3_26260 [Candidatus Heimdallarchaeota archaeon LC_3]|nr:MAG: hypothetical protein HeimC3_26260 [Candidatus Heimdallarchaeota archaeon LC_3]
MSIHNTLITSELMEQDVIKTIREGYFSCKDFFRNYTNEGYEIYTKKKKEFLRNLCTDYYNKYPSLLNDFSEEIYTTTIHRHQYIPIKFKDGGFEYPRSFITFMDRIKDTNQTPVKRPDLDELDIYMKTIPESYSLDDYFQGFFRRLKKVKIILRSREAEVLQLLSNIDFLKTKIDGSYRITIPTDKEILEALKFDRKNAKKVERAVNFLFGHKICYISGIIMNPAKLGYYFALIDNEKKLLDIDSANIFWKVPFQMGNSIIVCLRFEQVPERIGNIDYIPLTHWYWNVNMNSYGAKKEDPWEKMRIPNFSADDVELEKYRKWNLTEPLTKEFTSYEWKIIKKLSQMNQLSVDNIKELSPSGDSKSVIELLRFLVKSDVFQYYPNINFIGTDFLVGLRITSKEKIPFKNLIKGVLKLPIAQLFVNKELNELIGYVQLPKQKFGQLIEGFNDVKEKYPSLKINYSTDPNYLMNRSFKLK